MKLPIMIFLGFTLMAAPLRAEDAQILTTPQEKTSYGLGVDIARNLMQQEMEINVDILIKGLRDGLSGGALLLSDKELRALSGELQNDMRKKAVLNRRRLSGENRVKGYQFLQGNQKLSDVVTLASGVQYRILKAGEGKRPTDANQVECNYRGTLINGTEFDATEAGKPATLKLTQLVPGWREAMKLMPAGSKWQIFVPSQLAYGERGGNNVGPNETLVLEVELLAVR